MAAFENTIDSIQAKIGGMAAKLNKVLNLITKQGSRLIPLHNRGELNGEDYEAIFKNIADQKQVFDQQTIFRYPTVNAEALYRFFKKQFTDQRRSSYSEISSQESLVLDQTLEEGHLDIGKLDHYVKSRSPARLIGAQKKKKRIKRKANNKKKMSFIAKTTGAVFGTRKLENTKLTEWVDHLSKAFRKIDQSIGFKSGFLQHIYDTIDEDHDWEVDSFEIVDDLYGEEFDSQMLGMVRHLMKECKKVFAIEEYPPLLLETLNNRRRLKNVLPSLFKKRPLSDFVDDEDQQIEVPIAKALKHTYCHHMDKFRDRAVVSYFGEKIALLLGFNHFFKDWLVFMVIAGLVYVGIDMYTRFESSLQLKSQFGSTWYEALSIVFCLVLGWRKTRFITKWKQQEEVFSEKYGMNGLEETKVVRTQFTARMKRSFVTDEINQMNDDTFYSMIRRLIAFLIMAGYCVLTGVVCFYLLKLKRQVYSYNLSWDVRVVYGSVAEILLDFLEFIRIKIFDIIFLAIAKKMTTWLNFKYVADHENDLCLRLSLYQFVNNSMIIWLISYDLVNTSYLVPSFVTGSDGQVYDHSYMKSDICFDSNCEGELTSYFFVYSTLQLIWSLIFNNFILKAVNKVIGQFKLLRLKHLLPKTKGKKEPLNIISTFLQNEQSVKTPSLSSPNTNRHRKTLKNPNPKAPNEKELTVEAKMEKLVKDNYDEATNNEMYRKANMEIEKQVVLLEVYDDREDFDMASMNYQYMVNTYTYIVVYGCIFSHCYLTVWLIMLSEFYMMRHKLLLATKRPKPKSSNTIGIWLIAIQVVSGLAVLSNSFYISFVVFSKSSLTNRLVLFLVMTVALYLVDYLSSFNFMGGINQSVETVIKRGKFLNDRFGDIHRTHNHRMTKLRLPLTYERNIEQAIEVQVDTVTEPTNRLELDHLELLGSCGVPDRLDLPKFAERMYYHALDKKPLGKVDEQVSVKSFLPA